MENVTYTNAELQRFSPNLKSYVNYRIDQNADTHRH